MNVQPNGPLVTDWDAMHVHGLRQVDLKGLPYERRYMPEVPRTGMRLKLQTALYNKTDIDRMVAKRQLELDARIRHKREKYQAQKRRKDALLKGATDQIEKFSKCSSKKSRTEDKYGEVKLPDVVVQQIMGHLATIEPDGVYGPCLAAYSLASAALVSWDFYNASKHGFTLLEQQVQGLNLNLYSLEFPTAEARSRCIYYAQTHALAKPFPIQGGYTLEQWKEIIADPLSFSKSDLIKAAKELKAPYSGPMKLLVVRVLGAFGLKAPSQAPIGLLRILAAEKNTERPWEGSQWVADFRTKLQRLEKEVVKDLHPGLLAVLEPDGPKCYERDAISCALLRKRLFAAGVCDKSQLLKLYRKVAKFVKQIDDEWREKQIAEMERARAAAAQQQQQVEEQQQQQEEEQEQQLVDGDGEA